MGQTAYSETELRTISWDEEIEAVVIEWHKFATGEEFQEEMDTLLQCAEEFNASKQLANSQVFRSLNEDDKQWMMEDWTPRAIEAGIDTLAVVYPESAIAKMSNQRIREKGADSPINQHFTDDLEGGRRWVRQR